jgi:hypothetical protein
VHIVTNNVDNDTGNNVTFNHLNGSVIKKIDNSIQGFSPCLKIRRLISNDIINLNVFQILIIYGYHCDIM